jgi:hypothetical protein
VFSADLFDRVFGGAANASDAPSLAPDGLGAFAGPLFQKSDISGYLAVIGF